MIGIGLKKAVMIEKFELSLTIQKRLNKCRKLRNAFKVSTNFNLKLVQFERSASLKFH